MGSMVRDSKRDLTDGNDVFIIEIMDATEVMKAVNSIQGVVQQVNSITERIDRATRSPLARFDRYINGPLVRYQETSNRLLRPQDPFERFQQTTAGLDRHQFTRVTRILEGWQGPVPAPQTEGPRPLLERFIAWVNRRRRPNPFELYLCRAHEHPAVARRGSGRRLWFEEWRRAVLLAVADGFSVRDLRAAAQGVSPPRRRRGDSLRPRQQTAGRCFEERLRHTIFTHGPTPRPLPSRLVHGDGSLVPTG